MTESKRKRKQKKITEKKDDTKRIRKEKENTETKRK